MNYTRLGRANVTVSRICLGTMFFGGWTDEKHAFRIMDKALDMGINFFDTANIYGGSEGPGQTEAIIGRWLAADSTRRDRIVLATKVFWSLVGSQDVPNEANGISAYKVRRHVEDSMRRLKTDRIDLYQVHHIDRTITTDEYWNTFGRLEDQGKILYEGTSNFTGWGLVKFNTAAREHGRLGIVSEQSQYNLLNRGPELEVIPACLDQGIGLIPYMPLGGGLLAGKKPGGEEQRSTHVAREYGLNPESEQFTEYTKLCADLGEKEAIVSIAWVLRNPAVSSAIVGIRKIEHLDGLERAAELELSDEVIERLEDLFDINKGRPLKKGPAPEAYAW